MSKNKGFTLIELLVVIAIIGILSSVVLASLNSARNKGADAAIRSNLANTRAQAEIIYDNTASYATVCADSSIVNALNAAKNAAGVTNATTNDAIGAANTATCNDNGSTGWAIQVPMKSTPSNFACVDSTGAATTTTTNNLTATTDTTCG